MLNSPHFLRKTEEFSYSGKIDFVLNKEPQAEVPFFSMSLVSATLEFLEQRESLFLHPEERIALQKYIYPLRRHSFLLGRLAAKKAIINFENGKKKEFNYNVINGLLGEPLLENSCVNIALSHTQTYGVAIVSEKLIQIGVDIEFLDRKKETSSNFFTKNELNLFRASAKWNDDKIIYYTIWSVKEALVKYLKVGFTVALEILEIASVECVEEVFIVSFKNFHAVSAVTLYSDQLVLSICFIKNMHISLPTLKEAFNTNFFSIKTKGTAIASFDALDSV